jgi:uncharacterized membrane protein YfcA
MAVDLLWLPALFAAGALGGGMNAVAGGGTFFAFPIFLAAGIPPVVANATNTLALWPGSILAAVGYRRELAAQRAGLARHLTIALLGGVVGAILLLVLGDDTFLVAIPLLLGFATLLFAFKNRLAPLAARLLGRADAAGAGPRAGPATPHWGITLWLFVIATYGGYFGAGVGILMMAGLGFAGVQDLQQANALKNLLVAALNGIAIVIFVAGGAIAWNAAAAGLAGALVGGFAGARLARRLSSQWLGRVVVAVGALLTVVYTVRLF